MNNSIRTWKEFNEKYASVDVKKIERQALYSKKLTEEEKKQLATRFEGREIELEKFALKMQRLWQYQRNRIRLKTVNLKANHSMEFDELVHGQNVRKCINKDKLELLEKALQKSDWKNDIFYDKYLPQLALALFAAEKISLQQINTILEFRRLGPSRKVHHLADKKSDFDKNLSFIFEKMNKAPDDQLDEGKELIELSESKAIEKLLLLKQLISALPFSEQVIATFETYKYIADEGIRSLDEISLGTSLSIAGYPIIKEKLELDDDYWERFLCISVSAGVRDALGIVFFGINNYMRMIPTFGEKTPQEIEIGVRQKKRYGALNFPGTVAYKGIHNYKRVNDFEATSHDIYHAHVASSYGKEIQNALLDLIDLIRGTVLPDIITNKTQETKLINPGKKFLSKEIWDLIDGEFVECYSTHFYNKKLFLTNELDSSTITLYFFLSLKHLFSERRFIDSGLSLLGTIFILDTLANSSKWKKNKIDVFNFFKFATVDFTSLQKEYKNIYVFYQKMADDPLKIKILKVILYKSLNQSDLFSLDILKENESKILEKLKFKKYSPKESNPLHNNCIYFTYSGKKVTTESAGNIIQEINKEFCKS